MPPGTDTRERLVNAARELFLEHGYTATGIAQILARAEAKSGSPNRANISVSAAISAPLR